MREIGREMILEEAACVVGVGKGCLEKFVVWMMDGFFWHRFYNRVAGGGAGRRQEVADRSGTYC